jgi:hypothetical protein
VDDINDVPPGIDCGVSGDGRQFYRQPKVEFLQLKASKL